MVAAGAAGEEVEIKVLSSGAADDVVQFHPPARAIGGPVADGAAWMQEHVFVRLDWVLAHG
jgi:hypothetical protein